MVRIAELDLPARLSSRLPPLLTSVAFGLLCCGLIFVLRLGIDLIAPGGAPFALLYPAVVLSTLLARWQAGMVAGVVSILYIWYVRFPIENSFRFENIEGAYSLIVIALSAMFVLAIVELFRRAVHRAAAERDREIAERDLFLAEFDHRVKNNFAVVASLLDLQRRRAAEPATKEALGTALSRIESIARAHRHLYRGRNSAAVEMRAYLTELCAALHDALSLHGAIQLDCLSEEVEMPRDRAVSIGLVVNELVTNAVKHAFAGREGGAIAVTLSARPNGWRLIVADDGIGMRRKPSKRTDGGLGNRLIEAFARQAGGTIATDSDPTGTTVTLDLAR